MVILQLEEELNLIRGKDDDPRSMKLRQKAAANAERRKKELAEKLKPFKNKGNVY